MRTLIRHAPLRQRALRAAGAALGMLLLGVPFVTATASAQALRNHAAGVMGGAMLDTTSSTVTLQRVIVPVPSSLAELTPGLVPASSVAVPFDFTVVPTIAPLSPGVEQLDITVPAGFTSLAVLGVIVAGSALAPGCPVPGGGQFCATVSGSLVSVAFGSAVTTDQARITVQLSADAPGALGRYTFAAALINSSGVMPSIAGDANGQPGDANSLIVQVATAVDSLLSSVAATPALVIADGVASSTLTATLRDPAGQPLAGRTVTFVSSRGAIDTITQPGAPTDASGVATGALRSITAGDVVITASLPSDSLALPGRPVVTFTQGLALRVAVTPDRERVTLGQVVTYSVTFANLTPRLLAPVWLTSVLPAAFRYLPGSASIDGVPLADPVMGASAVFDVGAVPALVDLNGNGVADAGETGFRTLRYRAVVGTGATPGTYVNSVIAHDVCPTCIISNAAEAGVQVVVDPVFSLGTIVGRVFEDGDRDGRQGREEPGIAGARVALDDGTYAVTDSRGLYHFPAVTPGHRLVKIDLNGLSGVAHATTGESRFITLTSGLMGSSDFGVAFDRDTVRVSQPSVPGLQIAVQPVRDTVDVRGSITDGSLLVNGKAVALDTWNARLSASGLGEQVRVQAGVKPSARFHIQAVTSDSVRAWRLAISDRRGRPVRTIRGSGTIPEDIEWDCRDDAGALIGTGTVFCYQLVVETRNGERSGPIRVLGASGADDVGAVADERGGARVFTYPRVPSSVSVNRDLIDTDAAGRFRRRLDANGTDTLRVRLADAHGRVSEGLVALPPFEILSQRGTVRAIPEAAPDHSSSRAADLLASGEEAGSGAGPAEFKLRGRTSPGNRVELDGVVLPVAEDGTFEADVPVHAGLQTFGFEVRDAAGIVRFVEVPVVVSPIAVDGSGAEPVGSLPELEVVLPPQGARLGSASYPLSGRTEAGNRVAVNGHPVPVAPDGRFAATVTLPAGASRVIVTATDSAGNVSRLERAVSIESNRLFLVALADGAVGRLQGGGLLRDQMRGGDRTLYTEGRVAYYLKGVVRGRYLITSAYDSGIDEFATLFDRVDGTAEADLIANLDPERFYPVYGDSSTVVADVQRRGRFYLGIDSEALQATVGRTAIALEGGELAGFHRTLDGMQVRWQSAAPTPGAEPATTVALAGAQAAQVHVRDELGGTGGSLYYLSHRDIVAGSERIVLAIRDQVTGQVRARLPQQRGVDYQLQWLDGRVLFSRPVSSTAEGGSLVSRQPLSGDPVTIEVDYETRTADLGRDLTGGHVRQRIGEHVALGGTWVRDEMDSAPYTVRGVDGELRFGSGSRVVLERGSSSGAGSRTFASADGGLTFVEGTPPGSRTGDAWRAAADLDVGEWFGAPGRALVRGYLKQVDAGFVSSGNLSDRGARNGGGVAEFDMKSAGRLAVRFDSERQLDTLGAAPGVRSDVFGTRWTRDGQRWGGAAEFQARSSTSAPGGALEQSSLLSALAWYHVNARLDTRLERQQTVRGRGQDLTTLGLTYKVTSLLALDARAATGTLGSAAQAGATLALGRGSVYAHEKLGDDRSGAGRVTVLGSQVPLGTGSRAYTEYQWRRAGATNGDASVVGVQQQWKPAPSVQMSLSGEHGETVSQSRASTRTTLAAAITATTRSGVRLTSQDEVRFDGGAQERVQTLTSNAIEARLRGGLTVLGRWRWSETRDRRLDRIEARLEEHGFGFALRPEHGSGPNALARYTRQADLRPAGANAPVSGSVMDVFALEGTLQVNPRIQWSSKGAARVWRDGTSDSSTTRTHSTLLVNRLNTSLAGPFGLGVEYRVLAQREARDRRHGWMNELTLDASRNVRVGAGFNFSDFSDDEFSRNDSSLRGWFLRLQGRY